MSSNVVALHPDEQGGAAYRELAAVLENPEQGGLNDGMTDVYHDASNV